MRAWMFVAQMYWGPMSGWGWAGMWFGVIAMVLFWVMVIALVMWLVRGSGRGIRRDPQDRAKEILAERYARGEIDTQEYRERLGNLH